MSEDAFKIRKNINDFKYLGENYIENSTVLDFLEYEVSSHNLFDLGEKIKFEDTELYIKEVNMEIKNSVLVSTYKICTHNGLKQPRCTNKSLQGRGISGYVLNIVRDKVQVHLFEIDSQPPENGYWFPYQSMYASKDGSGWYCMPEKGDTVVVKFPIDEDSSAIARSSVSTYLPPNENMSSDKMANPNVRYIRNIHGMEIIMTPTSVIITSAGGGTVTLNENGQINVTAKNEINIKSDKDIAITAAGNMNIHAGNSIELNSADKGIVKITGQDGKVEIKGEEVYTN